MANMMDYLLWRGDLSFKQAEFNEVDNLIFSELVYVDFDGIVPSLNEDKSITLKEASKIFFEHHTDEAVSYTHLKQNDRLQRNVLSRTVTSVLCRFTG